MRTSKEYQAACFKEEARMAAKVLKRLEGMKKPPDELVKETKAALKSAQRSASVA